MTHVRVEGPGGRVARAVLPGRWVRGSPGARVASSPGRERVRPVRVQPVRVPVGPRALHPSRRRGPVHRGAGRGAVLVRRVEGLELLYVRLGLVRRLLTTGRPSRRLPSRGDLTCVENTRGCWVFLLLASVHFPNAFCCCLYCDIAHKVQHVGQVNFSTKFGRVAFLRLKS